MGFGVFSPQIRLISSVEMTMTEVRHRTLESNGIRLHVAEKGAGPLVVLCHGFPESWYSWRHQLRGLAEAGFHAVAPDMRGYGQTERPEAIDQYTLLHVVGDMVGLLDVLGAEEAVIAGHDWGAVGGWLAGAPGRDRFPGGEQVVRRQSCRRPATPSSISSTSRLPASPRRITSATSA